MACMVPSLLWVQTLAMRFSLSIDSISSLVRGGA